MSAQQQYDKVVEAMASTRRAMGLFEQAAEGPQYPESLVGIHPKLRGILDDLAVAASDLKEGGGL